MAGEGEGEQHCNARHDDSYASPAYWERRYRNQHAAGVTDAASGDAPSFDFDWLCDYKDVRPLLLYLLDETLHPGAVVDATLADGLPALGVLHGKGHAQVSHGAQSCGPGKSIHKLLQKIKLNRSQSLADVEKQRAGWTSDVVYSTADMCMADQPTEACTETARQTDSAAAGVLMKGEQCERGGQAETTPMEASLHVHSALPPVVLDLGAGNSRLLEALCHERPHIFALAMDYSPAGFECLLTASCSKHSISGSVDVPISMHLPEAVVADARTCLPLKAGSVGLVIDKGCVDAVLNDWDQYVLHMRWRSSNTTTGGHEGASAGQSDCTHTDEKASCANTDQMMASVQKQHPRAATAASSARALLCQVHRVLAPGGHYCVISYDPPRGRSWLLGNAQSSFNDFGNVARGLHDDAADNLKNGRPQWQVLTDGFEHVETGNFIYLLQKPYARP
eukprot:349632-Chlamydomonas_euryale.AAC.61